MPTKKLNNTTNDSSNTTGYSIAGNSKMLDRKANTRAILRYFLLVEERIEKGIEINPSNSLWKPILKMRMRKRFAIEE
ncbi:hypothetical protein YN1HA_7210 [Sulfurisphaera ohwakuensis]